MIYFDALTRADCEQIRQWRNADISGARTPYLLTELQQERFYEDIVSNRDSHNRYWAVCEMRVPEKSLYITLVHDETVPMKTRHILGIAGLTDIEWENGRAEIALMIGPDYRGKGHGADALDLLIHWGHNKMRLPTLYGNVYACNPDYEFWLKQIKAYKMFSTEITSGKWWDGVLWNTLYFQIEGL